MKIICPNCEASFQLADGSLGATGRKVRCTKCGTVWHAMPVSELPEPDDFPPPGPTVGGRSRPDFEEPSVDDWKAALNEEEPAASGGEASVDDASMDDQNFAPAAETNVVPFRAPEEEPEIDKPLSGDAPEKLPTTIDAAPSGFEKSPRPRKTLGAKRSKSANGFNWKRWSESSLAAASTALFLLILVTLYFGRVQLVQLFPDLASLYESIGMPVNLRGLEFDQIRTYREVDGATPVLVVEGEINNITEDEQTVPPIRFSLLSAAGREVYAWTMDPAKSVLDGGNRMSFKSRLPAPPEAAVDVQVRFTERRSP